MIEKRFISFQQLRRLVNEKGLEINPGIVRRLERRLQDPDFDYSTRSETRYVIIEGDVIIEPDLFIEHNIEGVRENLREALSNLAVDKATNRPFALSLRIVSQQLDPGQDELCVSGEVALTDPEHMMSALVDSQLDECFDLMNSPADLADLPASEILAAGERELATHMGRVARQLGSPEPLPYRLHPAFIPSLYESAIANDETGMKGLVRSCGEILAGLAPDLAGARLERIRKSKGGSSDPVIRKTDGAAAWRVSVTMGGIGWRLNFWRIPPTHGIETETVEFALVERKTDSVHIPE